MKKLYVFVLMFAALSFSQQHRLFWDGGDWKRLTKKARNQPDIEFQLKAAYINGVMDGRLYDYLKLWSVESSLADSLFDEMPDYLSTREMVKAVDHFYEDPYNLTIPVPSAVIIASMYAHQIPLATIDDYIKQCRFWINNLYFQMEQEGPAAILEEKIKKYDKRKQQNQD
ncbi:MAG: hypothetical protein ACE5D8_08455 [Fidelibacterota bacterium]